MIKMLLVLSFFYGHLSLEASPLSFGQISLDQTRAISLKQAMATVNQSQMQTILVKAVVKNLCEKKGCWMILEDQGQSVRVTFKDYSFFVSNKLKNRQVIVEGLLKKTHRTVEELRHLAKDGGESPATIAAINQDQTSFEFEALGVRSLN